jgi:hypothetical protein
LLPSLGGDGALQRKRGGELYEMNVTMLGLRRGLIIDQAPQELKTFLPTRPASTPLRIPIGLKTRFIGPCAFQSARPDHVEQRNLVVC